MVEKPLKIAGQLRYLVKGIDTDGDFMENRRFSEFIALRNALSLRWPGIYIPALPEKKIGVRLTTVINKNFMI